VQVGDKAPDFELPDQAGAPTRLSTLLADGPVVLFWYPAAMTPGCTKESCHFRDMAAEFERAGARRVGISMDAVDRQRAFADKHGFDYPLLSDAGGAVSEQYGVRRKGPLAKLGPTQRKTFVIAADGQVLDVISGELKFTDHADRALEALAKA
jgi:peroxiredoxin Q/BCP